MSLELSWQNPLIYYIKIYFKKILLKKDPVKFLKVTFTNFRHNIRLSRGKIWLWLLSQAIKLYFGAGRGGGEEEEYEEEEEEEEDE